MEIYILINEKAQGPYTRELVLQYLNSGQFKSTDLAEYAGSADWKPLSIMIQSWTGSSPRKASPSSPPQSAKRKPIVAIIACAALALGIAGAAIWMLNHKSVRRVAGLDGRKFPKSLAALNLWYVEPPEGQNAATFFLKGAEAIEISPADANSRDLPIFGSATMPALGEPMPPVTKENIAAVVQRNEAAWKSLQEGASFEEARYPIDLNLGPATILPHLTKIKRAAQFAQLRTIMFAANKQPQEAVDSILLSLAVAESLKNEPLLISQLVRIAANAIDVAGLEYALNSVALAPADLERLSLAFAKVESRNTDGVPLTRALIAEQVMALTFFDLPPGKLEEQLKSFQSDDVPKLPASEMMKDLKSQRAFLTATFEHALALRSAPFPERLKLDEYMASRAGEARNKQFYLCQMWLGGLGKATGREARELSQLRLAQTAIALERFRQENGSYPDSLAALVPKFLPQVPMDPVNGGEIHYEKKGAGYEATSTAINAPKPQSIKVISPPKL